MNLNLSLPALVAALATVGKNHMVVDAKGLRYEVSSAAPQGDIEAVNTAVAPQVVSASTKVNALRNDRPAPGLMGKAPSIITGHGHNRKLKSATTGNNNKLSIAIARPFTLGQEKDLVASFDDWSTFPLSEDGCSDYNVGLILSFSSGPDGERSKDAFDAYEEIEKARLESDGWGGCITSVETTFADIPADEDIYGDYSTENVNWVNGPNRQFERLFRYIEIMKKYDVWYLMEPDTYPKKMHWLDNLMNEIMLASPFALLGSKYDGQAWNYFADQLSLDLLHHISGNSVYNLTNPLLLKSITELESEADTIFNAVPYDLRLSQIMLEGATSEPCQFVFNNEHHHIHLPNKVDKFTGWWKEYAIDYEPVKESSVITNRANHVYKASEVEDYSLVHGKNIYLPWRSDKYGDVTLVVKARQGFDSNALLSMLASSSNSHPFSEVVVMTDETLTFGDLESAKLGPGIRVVTQERRDAPSLDICEAQVTSPWFMIIDDKHAILDDMELFVEVGSSRPLVGTTSASSGPCLDSAVCRQTVEHAQKLYPSLDFFVLANDVLFDSSLRNKFCHDLKKTADYQVSSKHKQLSNAMEMGEHSSDTVMATQYFAYLYENKLADSAYQIKSKSKLGINPKFQRKVQVSYSISNNIVDVDSSESIGAVPMLWHIPKSGGTTAKRILARCLGLVVASRSGSVLEERYANYWGEEYHGPDSLRVVSKAGVEQYLNVDIATIEGVNRAKKLDPLGSGLAEVIVSPDLGLVTEHLLSSKRGVKARAFAIFRHPVERAVSLYHYLQKATWENTYDPSLANMTIVDWTRSGKAENNWLTRTLVGDMDSPTLTEEHVNLAKDIIRQKFVVGLTAEMEESWKRFREYFGWDKKNCQECMERMTKYGSNSNTHSGVEKGSEEWDALSKINQCDMAIYDFVVKLFHQTESNTKPDVQPMNTLNIERELELVSDNEFFRRMTDCPDGQHCYNEGSSGEMIYSGGGEGSGGETTVEEAGIRRAQAKDAASQYYKSTCPAAADGDKAAFCIHTRPPSQSSFKPSEVFIEVLDPHPSYKYSVTVISTDKYTGTAQLLPQDESSGSNKSTLVYSWMPPFAGQYEVLVHEIDGEYLHETPLIEPSPFPVLVEESEGEEGVGVALLEKRKKLPPCQTVPNTHLYSQWDGDWLGPAFHLEESIRTGWSFLPSQSMGCKIETYLPETLRAIPNKKKIYILGRSVERGVFLSLVDLMLDSDEKEMLMQSVIGKCWGRAMVQKGNLEVTYQDFRVSEFEDPTEPRFIECHNERMVKTPGSSFIANATLVWEEIFNTSEEEEWPSVIFLVTGYGTQQFQFDHHVMAFVNNLPSAWDGTLFLGDYHFSARGSRGWDAGRMDTPSYSSYLEDVSKYVDILNDPRVRWLDTEGISKEMRLYSQDGEKFVGRSQHFHSPCHRENPDGSVMVVCSNITEMVGQLLLGHALGPKEKFLEEVKRNSDQSMPSSRARWCHACPKCLLPFHITPYPEMQCEEGPLVAKTDNTDCSSRRGNKGNEGVDKEEEEERDPLSCPADCLESPATSSFKTESDTVHVRQCPVASVLSD